MRARLKVRRRQERFCLNMAAKSQRHPSLVAIHMRAASRFAAIRRENERLASYYEDAGARSGGLVCTSRALRRQRRAPVAIREVPDSVERVQSKGQIRSRG